MSEIRKLPAQETRVETGPVQFGDDWPGLFIRGDNAGYYAFTLKTFLESPAGKELNFAERYALGSLQSDLSSCVVGPCAEQLKIKA